MAGPVRIAILANGAQARAEMARTAESGTLMGKSMSRLGKLVAGAFAVTEVIRAGEAVVKTGGDYVNTLNKIQAITKSSSAQTTAAAQQIEAQAGQYAKMGETANDAADGVLELTKAGLSLKQALAAVYPTAVLAKSGQLQVGEASALVANTLNAFNLKAKDAASIANDIANAADISSADVRDLAESFKYVSPLAAKSGISLAQTNAVLAELANSGVKASQAGTGLRKFLLSIQSPTGRAKDALKLLNVSVYDAQGRMRPLPQLLGQFQQGLSKLTQAGQNKALHDVFGLQGVVPASILIKGGVKGLAQYTAGVKQAGGAARLATATSKGLVGTLQTLRADAVTTADSLYRKYSPAVNAALVGALQSAQAELPAIIGKIKATYAEVEPTLKSLGRLAGNVGGDLKDLATSGGGSELISALKTLNGLVKGASDFLNGLPDPVRKTGVEAGIAALLFFKLSSGLTAVQKSFNATSTGKWVGQLRTAETQAARTKLMTERLGQAARTAAGIGGLLLLADGAQRSNKAVGALEDTLGGAAAGFSIGGPIGALIGGAGGGLLGLLAATKKSSSATQIATSRWQDYAGALDQVTGAVTQATKAQVYDNLQTSGAFKAAAQLGITQTTLMNAMLGRVSAQDQLNNALDAEKAKTAALVAQQKAIPTIAGRGGQTSQQFQNLQKEIDAHRQIINLLQGETVNAQKGRDALAQKLSIIQGIPKGIVTDVEVHGIPKSLAAFRQLAEKEQLTPKQIRTVISAEGIPGTKKQIDQLIAKIVQARSTKGDLTGLKAGVQRSVATSTDIASQGGVRIARSLQQQTGKAKPNLVPFQAGLRQALSGAQSTASSGGVQVGSALKSGISQGFSGTASLLAGQAASAVRAAIAAARAAAKVHSPSKETLYIGEMLGEGLAVGMEKKSGRSKSAAAALVKAILKGISQGKSGVSGVVSSLTDFIDKHVNLKNQKAENARQKAILKSLDDQIAKVRKLAAAQEKNNKALDKAKQAYADLQTQASDFASSIQSTFAAFADISNLGVSDTGKVSLSKLLADLQKQAQQAVAFQQVIQQLQAEGLNSTTIQQLLAAGPSALAQAQAIASGGAAAVAQVNALVAQITGAGATLAVTMTQQFYGAGLQAAQGLIQGLKDKQDELAKVGERLADAIVAAIKKKLNMNSPSRVMAELGRFSGQGLVQGLSAQEIYVKRSGGRLADSLVKGYQSRPALTAYLAGSTSASPGSRPPVQLTVNAPVGSDPVAIGKTVVKHLDAYFDAGGRRSTSWGSR